MPISARVTLTPKANHDLEGIVRYTLEKWGEKQAEKYYNQVMTRCYDLATGFITGRKRREIKGAPLSYPVGKHTIFYREFKNGIQILRILHKSMDIPRHFK